MHGKSSVGSVVRPPFTCKVAINGPPFQLANLQILQLLLSLLKLVELSFASRLTLPYELFEELVSRSLSHSLS